jgi:ABC-type uncharacterized transport system substrate-binding protein
MTPVKAQIDLLNRIKTIKTLGHVYTSSEANAVSLANIARDVCKEMDIDFVETTVSNSAEVKQAVQTIAGRVDGIYISNDNTVVSALAAVASVAAVGGAASAPVAASYHREDLVPVSIMLALLGYGLGNFIGVLTAGMCYRLL